MAQSHIAELPRRAIVAVGGPEAETFLNGLVTCDLTTLTDQGAAYGGLLTPQGKILFDFIVFRDGDRFLFDLPKAAAAEFTRRLGFYKLRANVEIADLSETYRVAAAWGQDHPPPVDGILAVDPRLKALGFRMIVARDVSIAVEGQIAASEADYDAFRIALGIPEGTIDFIYGDAFPHDVDMDQLGGVDFAKGCFIGQEVVSRMEHRGTARRRLIHVRAASPIPPSGAEITAGDKPIGTIMSSAKGVGIALIRLDRAKEAADSNIPLLSRGMPVEIEIPGWARFRWPGSDEQD